MTIRRNADALMLEDVCAIEDAEILLQLMESGAACLDWTGCAHLHTACLQVILASDLPIRGQPASPALARWVAPLLQHRIQAAVAADAASTKEP